MTKAQSNRKMRPGKGGMRRGKSRLAAIPSTFVPGPPAQRRFFVFEQVYGLTEAAAGAGAFNSFRINSIYDPDFTGAGSSALGYSTYSYLYGRYRVLRVRVILRFVDNTPDSKGGSIVGVIFNSNSTFSSNPLTWPAQPFAFSKVLQGDTGGQHSVVNFDLQPALHKIAGVTPAQFKMDQDYSATYAANPASSLYAHVFLTGKLSSAAEAARVEVRLVFDVELSQPVASITV